MNETKPPRTKILIVDDRPENLVAVSAVLAADDVELLCVSSGDEALEALLDHDVALALVDVQMPDMDGFQLAEMMRGTERTRRVPIIFVTAGIHDQSRVFRGYDAGAVDFLHKPIDERILRHKVRTFLELHRQRAVLAETLRLNEMFLAIVTHDLRNPLAAVDMAVTLLNKTADDKERTLLRRIRSSSIRMSRMIEDLAQLSKSRQGAVEIWPERIDMVQLVKDVVGEHELAASAPPIHVHGEEAIEGTWDRRHMEQVVSNLVGNAVKHGKAGTEVDVTVRSEGDAVTVTVHNEGEIPADVVPFLFDPFKSFGPRQRRTGMGLGLYIVKSVVDAHGGRVDVESTAEAGTTFRVTLPRTVEATSFAPPEGPDRD